MAPRFANSETRITSAEVMSAATFVLCCDFADSLKAR